MKQQIMCSDNFPFTHQFLYIQMRIFTIAIIVEQADESQRLLWCGLAPHVGVVCSACMEWINMSFTWHALHYKLHTIRVQSIYIYKTLKLRD